MALSPAVVVLSRKKKKKKKDYMIASSWRFPVKYYKSLNTRSVEMKNKQA